VGRFLVFVLVLGAAGCGKGGQGGDPAESPTPEPAGPVRPVFACVASGDTSCTADRWTNFIQGALQLNCGACHPLFGANCDVVRNKSARVLERLSLEEMPPSGMEAATRARLIRWLECGAPL
jgi:hypothetical protein